MSCFGNLTGYNDNTPNADQKDELDMWFCDCTIEYIFTQCKSHLEDGGNVYIEDDIEKTNKH